MILQLIAQAFLSVPASIQGPPPPNVLVVMLDDVGHTERPLLASLNTLAAQGMELTRFYAWPVCSPTRYAALAGRYPRRAGIGDIINAHNSATGASPPPNRLDLMLPEVLKLSHQTAIVGKWHLGRASKGNRADLLPVTESGPYVSGFDSWRAGNPNSIALPALQSSGYYDWYRVDDGQVRASHTTYATLAQRDAAIDWIEAQSEPWFLWLALNAAHAPYDPPPGQAPTGTTRGDYLQVLDYADHAILDVLAAVDLAETFVVILGDNGTPDAASVGPTGFWKGTTYEGGIRVPCVIAGPGIMPGVSGRLVSAVDLAPTLLDLVGAEAPRGFHDGASFADALGAWAGAPARAWATAERYDTPAGGGQVEGYDDLAFIEAPSFYPGTTITVRLKRRIVDADGIGPGGTADLIYDLIGDPFEIAPAQYALAPAAIRARFDSYLASMPARP